VKNIFLDTVGLLAVREKSDQWHEAAILAMREFAHPGTRTWTSDSVLLQEFVTMRRDFIKLRTPVTPTDAEIEQAWEAYERRYAAGAGIVDQISFVLMDRLDIKEAFTNDEHVQAAASSHSSESNRQVNNASK